MPPKAQRRYRLGGVVKEKQTSWAGWSLAQRKQQSCPSLHLRLLSDLSQNSTGRYYSSFALLKDQRSPTWTTDTQEAANTRDEILKLVFSKVKNTHTHATAKTRTLPHTPALGQNHSSYMLFFFNHSASMLSRRWRWYRGKKKRIRRWERSLELIWVGFRSHPDCRSLSFLLGKLIPIPLPADMIPTSTGNYQHEKKQVNCLGILSLDERLDSTVKRWAFYFMVQQSSLSRCRSSDQKLSSSCTSNVYAILKFEHNCICACAPLL